MRFPTTFTCCGEEKSRTSAIGPCKHREPYPLTPAVRPNTSLRPIRIFVTTDSNSLSSFENFPILDHFIQSGMLVPNGKIRDFVPNLFCTLYWGPQWGEQNRVAYSTCNILSTCGQSTIQIVLSVIILKYCYRILKIFLYNFQ